MKKKNFIITLLALVIISGSFFSYLYFYQDPRNGSVVISLFLLSVFFLVSSTIALVAFLARTITGGNELLSRKVKVSLREGGLAGVYSVVYLALAAVQLLTWWDSLLLALSLILFEIYFLSGREKKF